MSVDIFSTEYLDDLVQDASLAARRIQHKNTHTYYADAWKLKSGHLTLPPLRLGGLLMDLRTAVMREG